MQEIVEGSRIKEPLLTLNSPGGLQREALMIALLLRRKGVATVLLPEAICASACAYIFFGGFDLKTPGPAALPIKAQGWAYTVPTS